MALSILPVKRQAIFACYEMFLYGRDVPVLLLMHAPESIFVVRQVAFVTRTNLWISAFRPREVVPQLVVLAHDFVA
jgi:hypothetical protein